MLQTRSSLWTLKFLVKFKVTYLRDFEMFEKHNWLDLTGVYFTKYCKEVSEQRGISGWVKNTKKGTVMGKVQGNKSNIDVM